MTQPQMLILMLF